jgi:hypothetical protein
MANIKLEKILKNSFPLQDLKTVTDYYQLTRKRNSRKYIDEFDANWAHKWIAVRLLDLDKIPRIRILDVGTGAGIFAWICSSLGHNIDVTELPIENNYQDADIIRYFEDLKKAYELDKTVTTYRWEISKTETDYEFPSEKQYDLISMFRTNFDIGWSEEYYIKFIKECLWKGLQPKGKVYWHCPRPQGDILEMACKKGDIRYLRHSRKIAEDNKNRNIIELYK